MRNLCDDISEDIVQVENVHHLTTGVTKQILVLLTMFSDVYRSSKTFYFIPFVI